MRIQEKALVNQDPLVRISTEGGVIRKSLHRRESIFDYCERTGTPFNVAFDRAVKNMGRIHIPDRFKPHKVYYRFYRRKFFKFQQQMKSKF